MDIQNGGSLFMGQVTGIDDEIDFRKLAAYLLYPPQGGLTSSIYTGGEERTIHRGQHSVEKAVSGHAYGDGFMGCGPQGGKNECQWTGPKGFQLRGQVLIGQPAQPVVRSDQLDKGLFLPSFYFPDVLFRIRRDADQSVDRITGYNRYGTPGKFFR